MTAPAGSPALAVTSCAEVATDAQVMRELIGELFPICRSITGDGLRRSLDIIRRYIPISIESVPSGTQVLDWTVPLEWNIEEAYVARLNGERVIDFADHNLHVMQYSRAVDSVMARSELLPHIHSLPEHPDWIPYRTSYYKDDWAFCASDRVRSSLDDEHYRVVIDSDVRPGQLDYGELVIPGQTSQTVLLSCHVCHPSLANDNLSGVAVATMLARYLGQTQRRHTFRFLFIPGTIGSITWLARNEQIVATVSHGLVLSCLGDRGPVTYKQSRRGNADIDRITAHVLQHMAPGHRVRSFTPFGYDERQYCSPGFNLPFGCLMRTPNGEYPEYHTSADNISLLDDGSLAHSLEVLKRIVEIIEGNCRPVSRYQKGEPQLGQRGLYGSVGGLPSHPAHQLSLLWVLNFADGEHTLLDIAEQSGLAFASIAEAAAALRRAELFEPSVADV